MEDSFGYAVEDQPGRLVEVTPECSSNLFLKEAMLRRLAESDAHFKHQQRGDPDLTTGEKYDIAFSILESSRAKFLSRFWKQLSVEDIPYFEGVMTENDYEILFYLQEIRKKDCSKLSFNTVKNRRFEAMKKLVQEGDYFSEDSMKSRDPLLYEQMIGQHLSSEEVQAQVVNDQSLVHLWLEHVQSLHNNDLYERQRDKEEGQMEEEEEDEDNMEFESEEELANNEEPISELDKQMLRNEFLRTMQQRFLQGQDKNHFDYDAVDTNEDYDSLNIREHDDEEKYFDDDTEITRSHTDLTKYRTTNSASDEEDYNEYVVQEDVVPGLLKKLEANDALQAK